MSVKIIAEAGVNHNGNKDLAFELVKKASEAGADIVKFQTFKADKIVTRSANQADYQVENTGKKESQFEMLKRLELDYETHHELMDFCKSVNIEFLSTAFDNDSLDFLVNDLKLNLLKIPSGEITNAPFLLAHARTGLDLIISTGMSTLQEVENALGVLAFGYLNNNESPSIEAFKNAFSSCEGQKLLKEKVTVLHCTTQYPTPMKEVNLLAMKKMENTFNLMTGYSDHTLGIHIPVAAVSMGACLIEKHFTIDKEMEGPDHKASLDPEELKEMVSLIRDTEIALGDGKKAPRGKEIENKDVIRKSIVANKDIKSGETYTVDNLTIKRPGLGISPFKYWSLLGTKATKDTSADGVINE